MHDPTLKQDVKDHIWKLISLWAGGVAPGVKALEQGDLALAQAVVLAHRPYEDMINTLLDKMLEHHD